MTMWQNVNNLYSATFAVGMLYWIQRNIFENVLNENTWVDNEFIVVLLYSSTKIAHI